MSKRKAGGWVQKNSTTVYENPWIQVSHDEVINPSGEDGIYGVVNFKSTAVGIVPIDDRGYTWLVRQSRYTLDQYTWEIPEGGAAVTEDTLIAAQRELAEETGLRAQDWRELMWLHTSNSITDEAGVIYVASQLSMGEQSLEATEDIELTRLPFTEAVAMVMSGKITDALSVAALLRLAYEGLPYKQ